MKQKRRKAEALLIPYRVELVESNKSCIMTKVIVYDEELIEELGEKAIVGHGYLITGADGRTYKPTLYNLKGEELREGLFRIQLTEDTLLVTVPRMVQ